MNAAAKLSSAQFSLRVIKGPEKGAIYQVISEKITIGRSADNDIIFANDPKISRQHVSISFSGYDPQVTNISGKNILLVDGKKQDSCNLKNGSVLTLGSHQIEMNIKPSVPAVAPQAVSAPVPAPPVAIQNPYQSMNLPLESQENFPSHFSANNGRLPGATAPKGNGGRVKFYVIVAIVGLLFYALLNGDKKKEEIELQIRTSEEILKDTEASAKRQAELLKLRRKKGVNSREFVESQSSYIRCFRNYQQGQYSRAIQNCQAALALNAGHPLARRYLNLSRRKKDEKIQLMLVQGKLYKDRGFYKRCHSTLLTAMYEIGSKSSPLFKEAMQLDSECQTLMEGRY